MMSLWMYLESSYQSGHHLLSSLILFDLKGDLLHIITMNQLCKLGLVLGYLLG